MNRYRMQLAVIVDGADDYLSWDKSDAYLIAEAYLILGRNVQIAINDMEESL